MLPCQVNSANLTYIQRRDGDMYSTMVKNFGVAGRNNFPGVYLHDKYGKRRQKILQLVTFR